MASEERNAMAELAENLSQCVIDEVAYDSHAEYFDAREALKKAYCIISALAKFPINDIRAVANLPKEGRKVKSFIDYTVWAAVDMIENCRVIAEEGATNG